MSIYIFLCGLSYIQEQYSSTVVRIGLQSQKWGKISQRFLRSYSGVSCKELHAEIARCQLRSSSACNIAAWLIIFFFFEKHNSFCYCCRLTTT